MKLFLFVLFLSTIIGIKCDEDLTCKSTGPASTSKRLHDHLFCEYDSSIRPVTKKETSTIIFFRLAPQYIEFDEQKNTLLFFTWLDVSWLDMLLNWDPAKWDNIQSIHVKSYDVWTPSLTVFNHGDLSESDEGLSITDCLLTYNGTVNCVTPTKYTSHCPTNYDEWPYDKHNCSIRIGAWMFEYSEMKFNFSENEINMTSFRSNNQWDVHISKRESNRHWMKDDEGEMSVGLTVFLQRHSSRLAIIYILPIVVLMILTMIVLWLDSESLERIFVACINFICHILGLSDLHYYFPTKGSSTTPKILLFYEASVGLAAFALIFTCLLRKLRSLNVSAPMWVVTFTGLVMNSPLRPFLGIINVDQRREAGILDEGDGTGDIKASRDRTWHELATILECISFGVVLLIYVIMLAIVLPPRAPKDHSVHYWM